MMKRARETRSLYFMIGALAITVVFVFFLHSIEQENAKLKERIGYLHDKLEQIGHRTAIDIKTTRQKDATFAEDYDVSQEVASHSTMKLMLHTVPRSTSLGKAWNELLARVKTKYFLLVGEDTRFFEETKLEYLLHAFYFTDAKFVAGSIRNRETQMLEMPCYRTRLGRWTLKMKRGYEYSLSTGDYWPPCVACESIKIPFLGETEYTKSLGKFDERLNVGVITDFFQIHKGALVCPNTIFEQVSGKKYTELQQIERLLPLARKLRIDSIEHDEGKLWLCKLDWTLATEHAYWMAGGLFTPPCLYARYDQLAKEIFQFLTDNNIGWYLSRGDMLGALKFNRFSPWDGDFDIHTNLTTAEFKQRILPLLEERGYEIIPYYEQAFVNIRPEKWGKQVPRLGINAQVGLGFDPEQTHQPPWPTKFSWMKYGDYNVRVPLNPFEVAHRLYKNTFFEHRFHKSFGGARFFCKDTWFEPPWLNWDGIGEGLATEIKPSKVRQRGHAGCLPDMRSNGGGSFVPDFNTCNDQ